MSGEVLYWRGPRSDDVKVWGGGSGAGAGVGVGVGVGGCGWGL